MLTLITTLLLVITLLLRLTSMTRKDDVFDYTLFTIITVCQILTTHKNTTILSIINLILVGALVYTIIIKLYRRK